MAYLALYRRFRPSGFDGVIGQEHIVRTLKNQIKTDRVGHAYLFCGARGTGKTSTAKIFARAINCLSPKDGSPCGECENCKALISGASLDISEMDAASNNKVENVREIREKVQYPPVNGKYKVYIIDEVHMLTTEAFNALLKTLEEPPEHAVFILATTEVHKLPATILSRCMRFDFRLVPTGKIFELIKNIYREIGKDFDDEALYAVARAGNGSIRDALSIADICVSYRDGKLTYSDVLEVLGSTDSDKITSLVGDIINSNVGSALETVENLSDAGKSVGVLCRDIITRIRETIICKTCADGKGILELPDSVYEQVKKLGENADEKKLLRAVEIFSEAEASLRYSATPRIVLETACIKAAQPQTDYNIDALLTRMTKLESEIESLKSGGIVIKETPKEEKSERATEEKRESFDENDYVPEPPPEEEYPHVEVKKEKPQPIISDDNPSAGRIWGTVVRKLRAEGNIVLWVACQDMRATLKGKTLTIIAKDDNTYGAVTKDSNLSALSSTVRSVGDYDIEVVKENEVVDGFDRDAEKVKELFGANKVKIED